MSEEGGGAGNIDTKAHSVRLCGAVALCHHMQARKGSQQQGHSRGATCICGASSVHAQHRTEPTICCAVLRCAVLQVWAMVQQASAVMQVATGGNLCNMDILAW